AGSRSDVRAAGNSIGWETGGRRLAVRFARRRRQFGLLLGARRKHRQREGELATTGVAWPRPDAAAVRLDEPAAYRKADADAGKGAGDAGRAVKGSKDFVRLGCIDAVTAVKNGYRC